MGGTFHGVGRRFRLGSEPRKLTLTADAEFIGSDAPNTPRETLASLRLPSCFLGGWVGFATYDTVRYLEPGKLPFSAAPKDDRGLPDLHFGLYRQVVVFDNALWHDKVADPAQRDAQTVAIRELGRTVAESEDLVPVLLPVGDGLLCAKKVWTSD